MKKTPAQKEAELREQGYLSYDEADKSCPASHELYTAHLYDEVKTIHWCEKCKQYYTIERTKPAINLAGINEHLQPAFAGLT